MSRFPEYIRNKLLWDSAMVRNECVGATGV